MLTRDEILARKITGMKTEKITLEGVGDVIIRGLSRNEGMQVQLAETVLEKDNLLISFGLVDPHLSPEDVGVWGENEEAGMLTELSGRIAELSGMVEGAGKSRVSRPRRRS